MSAFVEIFALRLWGAAMRSKWWDWQPPKFEKTPEGEPSKPAEPSSVGFVGAPPGTFTNFLELPASIRDWPAEARDHYEERIAIMQFDGGLSEREAETRAEADTRAWLGRTGELSEAAA